MLMAQIQAGIRAENEKKKMKEQYVRKPTINEYLPNAHYQTRVHRYYLPPHGPRRFHGQKYNILYKYKYFYG